MEKSTQDEWTAVTNAFSGAEEDDDEGPGLNILSAEGLEGAAVLASGLEKIPLDQAANLIAAQEAAHLLRRDEIDAEEFVERMTPIIEVAENGVKLFSAEVVKKEVAKLSPEEQGIVAALEEQVYLIKEGVDLMLGYLDSQAIDDLDRGLECIEKAMVAADEIQDRAIEMARVFAEEEAERKAAEAEESEEEPETEDQEADRA